MTFESIFQVISNSSFSSQLELLQKDEKRIPERKAEIDKELCEVQRLMLESPAPLPKAYIKFLEEPKCDEDDVI